MFENAPLRIRPPHLRWRVVPIPSGDSLHAYLAGPQVTVDVHWNSGASKPCRCLLTKGALKCSCEAEPQSVRTIGYVPLITTEKEQLVVIVSATVAAAVSEFVFGTPLELIRPRKVKTPLRVRMSNAGCFNTTNNALFKQGKPRDIRKYLLHLWQDEELERYFTELDEKQLIEHRTTNHTNELTTPLGAATPLPDNVFDKPVSLISPTRKKKQPA